MTVQGRAVFFVTDTSVTRALFLRSRETNQMQFFVFFCHSVFWKLQYVMCYVASVCQSCPTLCFRHKSVKRMTSSQLYRDKISFVRHSNTGRVVPLPAARGHLLTSTLLLMPLCICLCLVLRQWSDWFSRGCLSVCRISLLSEVLHSACLPRAFLPNSCRSLRNSWIHLSRSQVF